MVYRSLCLALLLAQATVSRFTHPIPNGYGPGKRGAYRNSPENDSEMNYDKKSYYERTSEDSTYTYYEESNKGNKGKLIFEDNFDELDLEKWRHEITMGGGGNWEFQFYYNNRTTSFVEDGKLHLKPVLTSDYMGITDDALIKNGNLDLWGNQPNFQCTANGFYGCQRSSAGDSIVNPIMSTQLRSHQSFNFKYGRVEVRAKLPKGDWLWPAIWFLPTHHAYGGWPASGEIDLLEARGNGADYKPGGIDTVASTLHWGTDWMHNQYNLTTNSYKLKDGTTFADEFHTFTLEWGPTYIRTLVDDKHKILDLNFSERSFWDLAGFENKGLANPWKGRPNIAPFDQKFYIIFNLAVGGTNSYFPDEPTPSTKMDYKDEEKVINNRSEEIETTRKENSEEEGTEKEVLEDNAEPKKKSKSKAKVLVEEKSKDKVPVEEKVKTKLGSNNKPWKNGSKSAAKDFLQAKDQWYPTWLGKDGKDTQTAFVIDYIRVYSLE